MNFEETQNGKLYSCVIENRNNIGTKYASKYKIILKRDYRNTWEVLNGGSLHSDWGVLKIDELSEYENSIIIQGKLLYTNSYDFGHYVDEFLRLEL